MDERRDTGEVYPGGKVVYRQRRTEGGDVRHSEFATIEALGGRYQLGDVASKVNTILATLKG